jgi:hypothetical protein
MKKTKLVAATVLAILSFAAQGCAPGSVLPAGDASSPAERVASRATEVASQIGGADGFGGGWMDGYMQQMMPHMGFNSQTDLATPGSMMTVTLHNQASQSCIFHLSYFSSLDTPAEQTQDVTVPANTETTVQIPCSEIVGAGPLDVPGGAGCILADGQQIGNMMTVPGFMGTDYACGSIYHMYLMPDVNDLNGNGDTTELIVVSEAMQTHMQSGGMMGHMGGNGRQ